MKLLFMGTSDFAQACLRRVLEEGWLPSHSKAYKDAYKPAYRVLHAEVLEKETF